MMDKGFYFYRVMTFGRKNTGATYLKLSNRIIQGQIGMTTEIYIDDMVLKSKKITSHLVDLEDIFLVDKQFNMKLNPAKCVFGVREESSWDI